MLGSSGAHIVDPAIAGMGHPKAGGISVCGQEAARLGVDSDVGVEAVVLFNAVFEEEIVPHTTVANIAFNRRIVGVVDYNASLEAFVDSVPANVGRPV